MARLLDQLNTDLPAEFCVQPVATQMEHSTQDQASTTAIKMVFAAAAASLPVPTVPVRLAGVLPFH